MVDAMSDFESRVAAQRAHNQQVDGAREAATAQLRHILDRQLGELGRGVLDYLAKNPRPAPGGDHRDMHRRIASFQWTEAWMSSEALKVSPPRQRLFFGTKASPPPSGDKLRLLRVLRPFDAYILPDGSWVRARIERRYPPHDGLVYVGRASENFHVRWDDNSVLQGLFESEPGQTPGESSTWWMTLNDSAEGQPVIMSKALGSTYDWTPLGDHLAAELAMY